MSAEEAFRILTASYAAEVESRQQPFRPTEHTTAMLWRFALYITAQRPRFGALLCGGVGNGKTTMLYAFQQTLNYLVERGMLHGERKEQKNYLTGMLPSQCLPGIQIITAKDITKIAKAKWERYEQIRGADMLAIDELGEEPREVKDYGNILSPIIDLIEHRYVRQQFTLITTNLAPGELQDVYGSRVADRLREMVEVINFGNAESFRGR